MAKTPKKINIADLKPRNPIVKRALTRRWGAGVHKGSKADKSRKACRGNNPKEESLASNLALVDMLMTELFESEDPQDV